MIKLEEEIKEIILDEISYNFGIVSPRSTQPEQRCKICKKELLCNFDYKGNWNGWKTHNLKQCLENMANHIINLEERVKELENDSKTNP